MQNTEVAQPPARPGRGLESYPRRHDTDDMVSFRSSMATLEFDDIFSRHSGVLRGLKVKLDNHMNQHGISAAVARLERFVSTSTPSPDAAPKLVRCVSAC